MTHEKNIDAILGGFHTAGNDNDADFPHVGSKLPKALQQKHGAVFLKGKPYPGNILVTPEIKHIYPHSNTPTPKIIPATPDYSIPQSETNVPGLGVEDTYDSTPPEAVAPPSPEMSEEELIEKPPTVEDSSQTGLIDQIIRANSTFSEIETLLIKLNAQVELNDLIMLKAEQEEKLVGVLLLHLERESCALLEKILLSPTLKNPEKYAGGEVRNNIVSYFAASDNGDLGMGLKEFLYQFSKVHEEALFQIHPLPLIHNGVGGMNYKMSYLSYSAKRMIEDELGKDVANGITADWLILSGLTLSILKYKHLYYSLPIKVARIYESRKSQGQTNNPKIYSKVLDFYTPYDKIPFEKLITFAFEQLTGDKATDTEMIDYQLFGYLVQFVSFLDCTANSFFNPKMLATATLKLLPTHNSAMFVEQFFEKGERESEKVKEEMLTSLYSACATTILGHPVFVEEVEQLFPVITKADLIPLIRLVKQEETIKSLASMTKKDDIPMKLSTLSLVLSKFDDQFFSQIETWSSDPQLQAIGLTEKSELFAALYYGWTVEEIVQVVTTLQTFFSLTPDTVLSWKSFPWKDESLKSFTAADVNEELLQSYADKLPVYAQSKKYEAGKLTTDMVGISQFLSQISQGSINNLYSIPSFELINFLEPEWFDTVCELVDPNSPEYESSVIPLTADIEALLAPYLKDREIDTPDGIWRHSKTILRDKDSLEDQMMHLTIVEKDGQAKLQISFKLTSVCLKENQEKITGLSRVRKEERLVETERLTQLGEKIAKLGWWCSNCGKYHFHDDSTEQQCISKLETFGFTKKEYDDLIFKKKSGWNGAEMGTLLISFTSTPTAIRNLGAERAYHIEATQQIVVSDDVMVSVFTAESESTGYTGTVHFDLKLDDETTTESVTSKLAIIMKMMGIQDVLSPVTPESRQALAANRYKWNRRVKEVPPETAERLEYTAITNDYSTFVEHGFHEKLVAEGLSYIYSDHGSVSGAVGLFRLGLLSSNERRRLGLIRGGWSTEEDINSGGSDYAFARAAVTWNVPSNGNADYIRSAWDPSVMDRTDYFTCESDNYGATNGDTYDARLDPIAFMQELKSANFDINEVCFKKAVGPDKLILVIVNNEAERIEILEELAKRGTTHHRGVPVEDCVIVIDAEEKSDEEYNQILKSSYDQLRERYKQVETQQMTGELLNQQLSD